MTPEPRNESDYSQRQTVAARRVLVDVGQVLASFVDCLVVVGGWTPDLLLPDADEPHVGSIDVDLALDAAKLKDGRYAELVKLLLDTKRYRVGEKDFQLVVEVDLKDGEKPVLVEVEFLAPRAVKLKKNKPKLLQDFRVLQIDACSEAFKNPDELTISGENVRGATNTVRLRVASLADFLVMKAHAIGGRDKPKDTYDFCYCLEHFPAGMNKLAEGWKRRTGEKNIVKSIQILREKFASVSAFGPQQLVEFHAAPDADTQAMHARRPMNWCINFWGCCDFRLGFPMQRPCDDESACQIGSRAVQTIMKALPTLLVLWCLAISSQACVWIKGTTKEGKRVETSGLGAHRNIEMRLRNSLGTDLRAEGEELERKLRGASSFDDRNDYAVALMYLGRAPEAVELLRGLETEKPGEYATAANLGTALELAGNNPEALRWIREGVRRNAKSHEGTEWLHVKILEAKINSQKDPGYFGSHSVLNLDPATLNAEEKRVRMDGKDWEVSKLTEALQYQLIERTKFVKKNDPAVASLFFDYAALERATGTLEAAKGLLQMAIDFGYPAGPARKIMEQYDAVIRRATLKMALKIAGGSLLGIAFIAYAFKRKWIVVSRASVRSHRSAEVS